MNRIHYGMPTLIELSGIEECIEMCKELGLQFIEINMNMPEYQLERLDIQALKTASRHGIYFTFHLDENFNIADFNSKIALAYTDTMLSTIEIAKEINSPIINMHMAAGVYFTLPDEKVYLFEKYRDFYMNALAKFREQCDKCALGSNVKICIENSDGFLPFMKDGVNLLLQSDVFQLTYDIGHGHCAPDSDESFILANKDRLHHMHIHDAKGNQSHLVLGRGEINVKDKLELAISQNCRCVLETKTVSGLRESVAFLRTLSITH